MSSGYGQALPANADARSGNSLANSPVISAKGRVELGVRGRLTWSELFPSTSRKASRFTCSTSVSTNEIRFRPGQRASRVARLPARCGR